MALLVKWLLDLWKFAAIIPTTTTTTTTTIIITIITVGRVAQSA